MCGELEIGETARFTGRLSIGCRRFTTALGFAIVQ
jgi:hypothetical protein